MDERPTYLSDPDPSSDRRRRRIALIAVLIAFTLIVTGITVVAGAYRRCKEPPVAAGGSRTVVVADGATGQEVVQQLADAGLIRCGGTLGNLLLRASGRATAIRAGTYDVPVGASLDDILALLTAPPASVPTVRLTVPEGLRIGSTFPGERSVASVVQEQTGVSANAFAAIAESGRLALPRYLPAGSSAEGFLFPDTYQLVKKGLNARKVAERMIGEFEVQAKDLDLVAGAKALGLTPYELVTVASMIEREAQVDQDRALIAGVIANRLANGDALGIDATLLYDDPTPDGRLSSADLRSASPYNTRRKAGLPPTPIASPGRASLEAALHPRQTDFFFYVLCHPDGEGVHRFARTYEEHLANVQECLGG